MIFNGEHFSCVVRSTLHLYTFPGVFISLLYVNVSFGAPTNTLQIFINVLHETSKLQLIHIQYLQSYIMKHDKHKLILMVNVLYNTFMNVCTLQMFQIYMNGLCTS